MKEEVLTALECPILLLKHGIIAGPMEGCLIMPLEL